MTEELDKSDPFMQQLLATKKRFIDKQTRKSLSTAPTVANVFDLLAEEQGKEEQERWDGIGSLSLNDIGVIVYRLPQEMKAFIVRHMDEVIPPQQAAREFIQYKVRNDVEKAKQGIRQSLRKATGEELDKEKLKGIQVEELKNNIKAEKEFLTLISNAIGNSLIRIFNQMRT